MEENNKSDQKMYYRMLGGTGLQVSVLSFGFWATYGVKDGLTNEEGITSAKECMSLARQKGINLFDNAETYGNPAGAAEEIMGEAMAQLQKEDPKIWKRSEIIVSTKIFWGGVGVNERGLSRKHINEGLDAALKRLQVNYVDLLFCHRPDPFTPTETVVRSMTDIVRSGRATAWGTSEWSAQQITEAFWMANTQGLEPPQFEQPQYNMLKIDNLELHKKKGSIEKIRKLADYASSNLGCSMTKLALAWCIKNKNVSTILLGITKPEQLEENIDCLSVVENLTSEHMKDIDNILDNRPEPYAGFGGQGMRQIVTI